MTRAIKSSQSLGPGRVLVLHWGNYSYKLSICIDGSPDILQDKISFIEI